MRIPDNKQHVIFGGAFILANKLQFVADKKVGGISTKQWFLLRNLHDLPAEPLPTISMLAKETDTSRQNIKKMLDSLHKHGYVILRDNPNDRRSQTIELTSRGESALVQKAKESLSFFSELFSGISADECETLAEGMIKLIDNLYIMQEEFK